eukprot:1749371-Lingulodinium_polyedra.AAC.1
MYVFCDAESACVAKFKTTRFSQGQTARPGHGIHQTKRMRRPFVWGRLVPVSYTHLRAHET